MVERGRERESETGDPDVIMAERHPRHRDTGRDTHLTPPHGIIHLIAGDFQEVSSNLPKEISL